MVPVFRPPRCTKALPCTHDFCSTLFEPASSKRCVKLNSLHLIHLLIE